MGKMSRKDIAELIGLGAIVASLVFVGLELRQTQKVAQASQYQDRMRTAFDYFFEVSTRDVWNEGQVERLRQRYDLSDLNVRDRMLLEEGNPKAIGDWWVIAEVNLMVFDNYHFQYQLGLSTDEAWQSQRNRLKGVLQTNSFAQQQIKHAGYRYRSSFVTVANELISEIEAENK